MTKSQLKRRMNEVKVLNQAKKNPQKKMTEGRKTVIRLFGRMFNEYIPEQAENLWQAGVLEPNQIVAIENAFRHPSTATLLLTQLQHVCWTQVGYFDDPDVETTLTRLQHASLRFLKLNECQAKNWSLLKAMPLQTLCIDRSDTFKISDLAYLGASLTELHLGVEVAHDFNRFNPLVCLRRLVKLSLPRIRCDVQNAIDDTRLMSLEFLYGLTSLQELDLSCWTCFELTPLQDMTQLQVLKLDAFHGSDLAPLQDKRLRVLHLNAFSGFDLSILNPMPLQDLRLQRFVGRKSETRPGEAEPTTCLSSLQHMPLTHLNLSSFVLSRPSDVTLLESCTRLSTLCLDFKSDGFLLKRLSARGIALQFH
jgi:hypothetical protein